MGWFYSLGISFDAKTNAQDCLNVFKNHEIKLSNLKVVECNYAIIESNFLESAPKQYILAIHILGMNDIRTDQLLFTIPYFYEIRDSLYQFLLQLELHFNYAFWEAEGAERLVDQDFGILLKNHGIESIYGFKDEYGDPNAAYFSGLPSIHYKNKRYLDGLIISNSKFLGIKENSNDFKEFKPGYKWLPV